MAKKVDLLIMLLISDLSGWEDWNIEPQILLKKEIKAYNNFII